MKELIINRNKVVFVNLTEMEKYDGLEENLHGGGRFIEENGYGHEIFNFHNDNGKCYGYTPPYSRVNLGRISNEINQDALGRYVDDVFVIFTCSRENKGRIVCGYYNHARIYEKPVNDNREKRKIISGAKTVFAEYNIICDVVDTFLIDKDDRTKKLPRAPTKQSIGHGQKSIWYTDKNERKNIKNDIIDYLQSYGYYSDEFKYHSYDESKIYISTSKQYNRSQALRKACIQIKGCYCNICGFNFEEAYGELGKDYIEVHHITSIGELSSAKGYTGTDPDNDLIPLCSNCHSMIHRVNPPLSPDELKRALNVMAI